MLKVISRLLQLFLFGTTDLSSCFFFFFFALSQHFIDLLTFYLKKLQSEIKHLIRFASFINTGKYMTFIMDPLLYPNIIKQGRQLDFHEFSNRVASFAFGYPPVTSKFPGLKEQITRGFILLQGDNLTPLTESMMGNLMLVFRQDYLDQESSWKTAYMYKLCNSIMFEATFLTMYGKPPSASRHSGMSVLETDFIKFDKMFPLLVAQIPIWLLGRTRAIRERLINYFLPHQMSCWSHSSEFTRTRFEMFEQYDTLRDFDKAGR